MQPGDRKLLTRLSITLLVAWFVGDLIVGTAIQAMDRSARQANADVRRSDQNRRRMGYVFASGRTPDHGLAGLKMFHSKACLPLRIAGGTSLALFVAFGPVGGWARSLSMRDNRRALFATVLVTASLALFGVAQFIAYQDSTTVMQPRKFTAAELEKDRRERTLVNPPPHLNPGPGRLRSITFGNDRTERVASRHVDRSVRSQVDLLRLAASVIGGVGLLYVLLAAGLKQPKQLAAASDGKELDPEQELE